MTIDMSEDVEELENLINRIAERSQTTSLPQTKMQIGELYLTLLKELPVTPRQAIRALATCLELFERVQNTPEKTWTPEQVEAAITQWMDSRLSN